MSHGVQLSGNEMLNRKVLSSRRKVRSDETVRRETGRVFHARAAATGNARSPRLHRWSPARTKSTWNQTLGDDMPRCWTSGEVSRRGTVGHYGVNNGRPGHTNGTGCAL